MSPTLAPQKDFPIVRQISNHLDAGTYYVQAIVRDADGNTLDTVNLTSLGGQRFQKRYRVPVDRSGQGTYISIVTSVYTDSGYTTKSNNYGDEENTYLIYDFVANRGGGSRGGGVNFDLFDIKRVVKAVLDENEAGKEVPAPIEFPEMPKVTDYGDAITLTAENVGRMMADLKRMSERKEVDLFPVLEGIQNLANSIDEKPVTEATDLTDIVAEVDDLGQFVEEKMIAIDNKLDESIKTLSKLIVDTMEEAVSSTEYVHETKVHPVKRKSKATVEAESKPPFDLRKFVK